MRKWMPVARRAFEANEVTISTMSLYATMIASDPSATLALRCTSSSAPDGLLGPWQLSFELSLVCLCLQQLF